MKAEQIKILKPVSIESVAAVCEDAAGRMAIWLMSDYKLHGACYNQKRSEVEIAAMPDKMLCWLMNNGFIEIIPEKPEKPEFDTDRFRLKCFGNHITVSYSIYAILSIDKNGISFHHNINGDYVPFPVDSKGRIKVVE